MKFKNLIIYEFASIREALQLFEKSGQKFLVATDKNRKVTRECLQMVILEKRLFKGT